MGAVLRDSTLYTSRDVNKYIQDARDYVGRVVPIRFSAVIVSAATAEDTYNLCVIPANWSVVGLFVTTDGLGASAGSGVNLSIGDAGAAARYLADTDFDLVNAQGHLAAAGVGYRPTADTIVVAVIGDTAGVVGNQIDGHILCVPGA